MASAHVITERVDGVEVEERPVSIHKDPLGASVCLVVGPVTVCLTDSELAELRGSADSS